MNFNSKIETEYEYSVKIHIKNMNFNSKIETDNKFSFLGIEISRNRNEFIISIHHKPTFSGVFSHFDSFIP